VWVDDGDTLVTSTIDSSGRDASGVQVGPPGNPLTGPVYVRGAAPSDVLRVRFDLIRPNRALGYSACWIAPGVLDPGHPAGEARAARAVWAIDTDGGSAKLLEPDSSSLGHAVLPLAPFLGCFGVAPPRGQSISSATSGPHGGNMDYRGFGEGVTAFLPVFVEGALLFLGDGHALQGDGEIMGSGIEVSMDVTVTVSVLKAEPLAWPAGESREEIFSVGNARPLDQALQHATTEMLRWLQRAGLDPMSAHLLMGHCVRYDVGNVYNPAYTAVCRIPKAHVPR
jgi:acetamidase/formamidase